MKPKAEKVKMYILNRWSNRVTLKSGHMGEEDNSFVQSGGYGLHQIGKSEFLSESDALHAALRRSL